MHTNWCVLIEISMEIGIRSNRDVKFLECDYFNRGILTDLFAWTLWLMLEEFQWYQCFYTNKKYVYTYMLIKRVGNSCEEKINRGQNFLMFPKNLVWKAEDHLANDSVPEWLKPLCKDAITQRLNFSKRDRVDVTIHYYSFNNLKITSTTEGKKVERREICIA